MNTKTPKRSGVAVALVAGALALTACGSSSTSTTGGGTGAVGFATGIQNQSAGGTPKSGGVLTVSDFGEARSLDPTVTYGNGAAGGSELAAIYDTLMRYDYTAKKFVPQLAESLTSSNGDKTWTLKLRSGVKFTDGTVLDSAAVLKSLGYYESKYGYQTGLLLTNVADMKATDAQTVVFTLRSAWGQFPDMLAQGPGMILAPAAYANPAAFKPIGAGPFVFKSYSPGENLTLTANKSYVGGAPYLDGLKFVWLGNTDDQPKLDAVQNGTADAGYLLDAAVIQKAQAAKLPGMMFGAGLTHNFWINTRAGHPGSDLLVRQALSAAFDDATYVKRISNNNSIATRAIVAPSSPWYSPSSATFDLAKAKSLLAQAKAKGFDGTIKFAYSATPAAQAGAVLFQAMLQNAGFKVVLVPLRSVADQIATLYVQHNFDLAVAASNVPDVDPYTRLAGLFGAKSPSNVSGYSSPEMDQALADLATNGTPETGKAAFATIQKLWDEQVPGIGIDAGGVYEVWGKNVHGIEPSTETLVLFDKAWKN